MAHRGAFVLAIVALLFGATAAACVDLFHSTADLRSACDKNPALSACRPDPLDAGVEAEAEALAPTGGEVCAATPAEAKIRAEHACAWLGACETPMGQNGFGSCMLAALLAYDCASNPAHRVKGAVRDLWACLGAAQTCDAVTSCILPPRTRVICEGDDYSACLPDAGGVRIECTDAGAYAENCSLWGQTCVRAGGVASCSDPQTACGEAGAPTSCSGAALLCDADGGALAFDCSGAGAQTCGMFSDDAGARVSCLPNTDGSITVCDPSRSATCAGGVASSCPTGIPENLDCDALLGSTGACSSGVLTPPFDWTSRCGVTPPECPGDTCTPNDAEPAPELAGCVRGVAFPMDCVAAGLGPCRVVTTDLGTASRAACSPP